MKHSRFRKPMAFLLALMLCVTMVSPAFAARITLPGSSSSSSYSWRWDWNSILDKIFGKGNDNTTDTDTSEDTSDLELTLIEDETTVAEGTKLRASTYAATPADAGVATTAAGDTIGDTTINGKIIKYYPVTLYNYGDKYNDAMHEKEIKANPDLTTWEGMYFGGNSHGANVTGSDSYTCTLAEPITVHNSVSVSYNRKGNYSNYTSGNHYYKVSNNNYCVVTSLRCTHSFDLWNGDTYSWKITYDGGTATSSDSSITLYTRSDTSKITKNLAYANWNKWTGDFNVTKQDKHGNKTYSGLVDSTLDANKNIQFTKSEAGIFNNDTSVKDIYTRVGLPFVYDSDTKMYTFDANTTGAYFHTDEEQGTSSTPASGSKLYFTTTPQSHDFDAADKRKNGWFPFNDSRSVTTATSGTADYFFGMNATIPFTMTSNGRLKANDNNSDPITFNFSGDDDVWVFVDGKLVLDIGGVHNGMNGSINFATNEWSITPMNGTDSNDVNNAALSGKVFNDTDGTGKLNTDRATFAATDTHELTVYYLERGAGSSNCKIEFNLPMKDVVSVHKTVNTNDSDGKPLNEDTLTQINNRNFAFTLYKDDAAVANATYNLYNVDNQYISTASTDDKGKFTLKNGQTAKFIGEIGDVQEDGITVTPNSYYVVEDKDGTGWQVPKYSYTAKVANTPTVTESSTSGQSMKITAAGSTESEDSIAFICTNTLTHVDNTSIEANDDKIVIDYGLPVEIEPLKNDVVVGGTKSIKSIGSDKLQYGTATVRGDKITYTLNKQLTGVEVLEYTVKAISNDDPKYDKTATAKVYIIPATTMYYEENFTDLIRDSADPTIIGEATNTVQEPGVVGTVDDSPYGSDIAYLDDKTDSNGTSRLYDTTNTGIKFQYTFTGTGTSFFARTDSTSAYMKVVVADAEGNTVATQYRDNVYKAITGTDFDPLYNIPVYTFDAGEYENANGEAYGYGTYTVTVTLYRASATRGHTFYLDGIRVVNPLETNDANAAIANSAYASDGEAGMTYLTLRDKLLADADIKYTYKTDEDGNQVLDENNEPIIISKEPVWNGENFAVLTDNNGNITSASEYKSNGPKEEVYLYNGQSISFSLKDWDANTNKLYLGLKNPNGAGSATVNINGNVVTINNTVDCYYEISGYAQIDSETKTATFTITAGKNSLISATNIKVTGNPNFVIAGADNRVNGAEGTD